MDSMEQYQCRLSWTTQEANPNDEVINGKITKNYGDLLFSGKLRILQFKPHYVLSNQYLVSKNKYLDLENMTLSIKRFSEQKQQILLCENSFKLIISGTYLSIRPWFQHLKQYTIQKNYEMKYSKLELLGQGSQGKVYKVRCLEDGKLYASKQYTKKRMSKKCQSNLLKELQILRRLDHQGVTRLYETFENEKNIYLILECLQGGELLEKIRAPTYEYNEQFVMDFARYLLQIISYVHSKGIIHRDLKPENLILRDDSDSTDFVLADFGLSDYIEKEQLLLDKCGTIGYIAPEMLQDQPYGQKVDIYSIGVIIFVLFTGQLPFVGNNTEEIYFNNLESKINKELICNMNITDKAKQFVFSLLETNPINRPTSDEALMHEWFQVPSFLTTNKIIISIPNLPEFHQKRKFLSIKCTSPLWTQHEKYFKKPIKEDSSDELLEDEQADDLTDPNCSSKELIQSPKQCTKYQFTNTKIRMLNENRNNKMLM